MKGKRIIVLCMLCVSAVFFSLTVHGDEEPQEEKSGLMELLGEAAAALEQKAGEISSEAKATLEEAALEIASEMNKYADAEKLAEATEQLKAAAKELAAAASTAAQGAAAQAQAAAEKALDALSGAAGVVVDETGAFRNLVEESVDKAADTAQNALTFLKEQGPELMVMATEAVTGIDVSDPVNTELARELVQNTLIEAYQTGILKAGVDEDTMAMAARVVSGAAVYGLQYARGAITLSEYGILMSEVLLEDGLPAGVGMIADLLPVPGADYIAQAITTFFIQAAQGMGNN